jgi:hypothetical protein
MYLGIRKIRSAGRNSGSIEITLPALMQVLEGISCRLTMRDGLRPEIVLQPDFSLAQELLEQLWQKLRLGLSEIGDLPDFSMGDFNLAFFPSPHLQEQPPLAYADALLILQKRGLIGQSANNAIQGEDEALARLLACLAMTAGYQLNLHGKFALAFGDAVAYLLTGTTSNLGTEFERGMAHRIFWGEGGLQPTGSAFDDETWLQARLPLRRVYEQLQTWQATPSDLALARDQWYRALTVEMKIF